MSLLPTPFSDYDSNNIHSDISTYVTTEMNRNRIRPELLDWFCQHDLSPVDRHTLHCQRFLDVNVRHRTKQAVFFPGPRLNRERQCSDSVSSSLSRSAVFFLLRCR